MKRALLAIAIAMFVIAGAAQPAMAQQNDTDQAPEEPEDDSDIEEEENETEEEEREEAENEFEMEREGEIYIDLRGNLSESNEVTVIATNDGEAVTNARVEVNGEEVGRTDGSGELVVTISDTSEFEIEVEKNELEGELEVEIESENEKEDRERGESAQFDARLGTAINTLDSLVEIAPNEEARNGLQNALDNLREVQNNTDTASSAAPGEQPEGPERSDEAENESEEAEDESESQGPPEDRGPSQNSNRPGFVNQMLGGLFG
jgi:hypothetical protein